MAQLPPDGDWLIQQSGDTVHLTHRFTQEVLVKFNPDDQDQIGPALAVIAGSDKLTGEQCAHAGFWAGYFYTHARHSAQFRAVREESTAVLTFDRRSPVQRRAADLRGEFGDGRHPDYTFAWWMEQIAERRTESGYWDWVAECVLAAENYEPPF